MSLEAWGDEPWGAEDEPDIERLLGKGYRSADDMTQAAHDVIDERLRQQNVEGWTPEHDDQHAVGEIAKAAAAYAIVAALPDRLRANVSGNCSIENDGTLRVLWPWSRSWWKPKTRRQDLVRAAALLLAEIERLDRLEAKDAS